MLHVGAGGFDRCANFGWMVTLAVFGGGTVLQVADALLH
jgi:hypothetical protein